MGESVIIPHQGDESNNNYVVRISFENLLDTITIKITVTYLYEKEMSWFDTKARKWNVLGERGFDLYSGLLFSGRNEARHSKENLYDLGSIKNNVAPFVVIKRDVLMKPKTQRNFNGDDCNCFISQFLEKHLWTFFLLLSNSLYGSAV